MALVDLHDSRVSEAANAVGDIPQLKAREWSERASMVYATPDLRMLLERVLGEVGAVTERDLARILEVLLTSIVDHSTPASWRIPSRDTWKLFDRLLAMSMWGAISWAHFDFALPISG